MMGHPPVLVGSFQLTVMVVVVESTLVGFDQEEGTSQGVSVAIEEAGPTPL